MDPSSSKSQQELDKARLRKEKQWFRNNIAVAVAEEDDPLSAYEQYTNWLIEHENPNQREINYEVLEVLEEAVRKFKDDGVYKADFRYLKLWIAYAKRVEDPEVVYDFIVKNEFGAIYAQLYEEYALHLERSNKLKEAEETYRLGVKRCTRASEKMKAKYRDFKQRVSSGSTFKPDPVKRICSEDNMSLGAALFQKPLRNFLSTSLLPKETKPQATRFHGDDPYAYIKSETYLNSGKRPEKFRFEMSLLFRDGKEYCIQEARASSMGLLGKRWGPPPASELATHARGDSRVPTKREGEGTGRLRSNAAAMTCEPTVTINTKEALKDVFGMYNSPDKTTKTALGSKHAPFLKVDPMTPAQSFSSIKKAAETPILSNENAIGSKTPSAFRPFVDEINRKENVTPAPPKFKPFIDENANAKTPHITPGTRRALATKEIVTPAPLTSSSTFSDGSELTAAGEIKSLNVFSNVFTPAGQADRLLVKGTEKTPSAKLSVFQDPKDSKNFSSLNVFSRPPDGFNDVFSAAPPSSKDENNREPVFHRSTSAPNGLRQTFTFTPQPKPSGSLSEIHKSAWTSSQREEVVVLDEDDEEDMQEDVNDHVPGSEEQDSFDEDEEQYDAQGAEVPLGGRFGRFEVMTPIAERTFEYTTSTRAFGTPSDRDTNSEPLGERLPWKENDAALAAERLARELREEDEREAAMAPKARKFEVFADDLVERTGTLSLKEAIAVVGSFKPPNPCNPTDPQIISTLLSLVPSELDFYDLGAEKSNMLPDLQRFANRRNSKGSNGRSSTSKNTNSGETFSLTLHDRNFEVQDKLGEGGFGAVFVAREIKSLKSMDEDDDFDDEFDDEDEDEKSMVALKVVKPRNLWEYHILRHIHRTFPASISTSIIKPQALYAYRDESFLLLDFCSQGTLLDVVNNAAHTGVAQQGGSLDELLVMFFSIELLKFVEAMHANGFIHGDLKIDNCLLRLEEVPGGTAAWSGMYSPEGEGGWKHKGITMIDFGRTIDTKMFPPGQQFVADWDVDARDCIEMRENKPWTFQTDYHGLAGIVYCMLFGKYFDSSTLVPISTSGSSPMRHKISTQLKRYWQGDLWTRLFDVLLNPCLMRADRSLPIHSELGELRREMEGWLASNCNRSSNTLKGLLKKVELSVLSQSASR